MKHAHVVIPDLFLDPSVAAAVCADLHLPALEKVLACGNEQSLSVNSLEAWLCQTFAIPEMSIAPVTLKADGLLQELGYWLRADPVHLHLDRSRMILQTNVSLGIEEAQQYCAALNQYFAESKMQFFAPHPLRWYLRLEDAPQIITHPVSQVEGQDARYFLPKGNEALKWHSVMNEIQMLLYGHPLSRACEARGDLPTNSLWLWGGGRASTLAKPFTQIVSASELVRAVAQTADIAYCPLGIGRLLEQPSPDESASHKRGSWVGNDTLYVWEEASVALRRGDYHSWRLSILRCEQYFIVPLLRAMADGELHKITLDVLQEESSKRYELTRAMLWKFWRRPKPIASYGLV